MSATANIVIRCADPESILALLPDEVKNLAKVYHQEFWKEQLKERYHNDEAFRSCKNKRSVERSNQRYAKDPEYRARRLEKARQYYAQKKLQKTTSDAC